MPQTGQQMAKVLNNYLKMDDKNQLFVNLKLSFPDESNLWTRIYITEKSAKIARVALKKVGFDLDKNKLSDIDENDTLLSGREVLVDVVENGQYLNAKIVVERDRVPKNKLTAGQKLIGMAKKDDPDDGPPAEDIPF